MYWAPHPIHFKPQASKPTHLWLSSISSNVVVVRPIVSRCRCKSASTLAPIPSVSLACAKRHSAASRSVLIPPLRNQMQGALKAA